MKFILEILFVFALCACLGWCLEVCYRSYNNKKFINPGFLSGCYLPVYGCGGTALYLGCSYLLNIDNDIERLAIIFLFGCVVMTAIEFVGGIFLLKYYNLRLWDYSNNKWNYKGVVCLPFAFIWGFICVVFAYVFYPFINKFAKAINTQELYILLLGFYYGIFTFDLYQSLHLAEMIKKTYSETVIHFEEFKQKAKASILERKEKIGLADYIQFNYIKKYLAETRIKLEDIREDVKDNVEDIKENIEEIKDNIEELGKDIKETITNKGIKKR